MIFFIWWLFPPFFTIPRSEMVWGVFYQLVALFGGVCGLNIVYSWKGENHLLRRAVFAFSVGLLLQNLGQTLFSVYIIVWHIPVPYPSLPDIGYFGSIPFYIYGVMQLMRGSGIVDVMKTPVEKFQMGTVLLVMYVLSYRFFLHGYHIDLAHPFKLFFDLGYPLGQATYVGLALILWIFSKNIKDSAVFAQLQLFLVALVVQYFADFNFLFQVNRGAWIAHGFGDMLYLSAYFLMCIAILHFDRIVEIKNK
ncbi:MAG: hypothetical protein HYV32_02545 [Candidatus Kerfeldbacteria bacterium]|nr:hypothetical protein [Candidatus Kerfeldbacteria bacterium]